MNSQHDKRSQDDLTSGPSIPGLNATLQGLFQPADDPTKLRQQVESLRTVVLGLVQEVACLKAILVEKGECTRGEFAELLRTQMLRDHASGGPDPWTGHTYYAFTLSESERLKREDPTLRDEQLAAFRRDASDAENMT